MVKARVIEQCLGGFVNTELRVTPEGRTACSGMGLSFEGPSDACLARGAPTPLAVLAAFSGCGPGLLEKQSRPGELAVPTGFIPKGPVAQLVRAHA